jgi:hypothetical protein
MSRRDVHGSKRVVEGEHPHASASALAQDLGERICHSAGCTVIKLQRDGLLCSTQFLPEAGECPITVLRHLDAIACREPRPSGHRRHQGKLWSADADRGTILCNTRDVTNLRPVRHMEKANEHEAEDQNEQPRPTDPSE